ncbi:MAG TPA: sugar phosphate isomerase/epimerase family protein [Abditibacteriaceae bacterium]|nr:sugar phosphate isomerase/epimerase family protein [Abditibacteriaceae bacterium]
MAEELALGVMTGCAAGPQEALAAVRDLGIPTVQMSYPAHLDNEDGVRQIKDAVQATGVEITTVFCAFSGESYADIPTVRETVGLVPEATREERVARLDRISEFAQKLGVDRVAAHIGFMPEDESDPDYKVLVAVVQRICDNLKARGQVFALETGQETAGTLKRFIEDVGRDNLFVNFDPANMILYGNDNPVEAMDVLGPWVDGVHCKDGSWPTQPNQLGEEKPLGEGDVNIAAWIDKLIKTGFRGTLTIEREISGEQQRQDILKAKQLLDSLIAQYR